MRSVALAQSPLHNNMDQATVEMLRDEGLQKQCLDESSEYCCKKKSSVTGAGFSDDCKLASEHDKNRKIKQPGKEVRYCKESPHDGQTCTRGTPLQIHREFGQLNSKDNYQLQHRQQRVPNEIKIPNGYELPTAPFFPKVRELLNNRA